MYLPSFIFSSIYFYFKTINHYFENTKLFHLLETAPSITFIRNYLRNKMSDTLHRISGA